MAVPRRETVDNTQEACYHLYSRCVRRAFLCGIDSYTERDYSHRRQWILDRLHQLLSAYSFQLIGYTLCSNHYHMVARSRPDFANSWTPEEVILRWDQIHPFRRRACRTAIPLTPERLAKLAANPAEVALYRERLANLSWLMKDLNEYISKKANREDNCTGHFWEERFGSKILLDDCALITELVYADLNPIRAGIAATPEQSDYTSVQARIQACTAANNLADLCELAADLPADDIETLDELSQLAASESVVADSAQWLCPIGACCQLSCGVLPQLSLQGYLELVDWTGRALRDGNCGAIPADLAPLLDRLEVKRSGWLLAVGMPAKLFKLATGKAESLAALAKQRRKQRVYGRPAAKKCFLA